MLIWLYWVRISGRSGQDLVWWIQPRKMLMVNDILTPP